MKNKAPSFVKKEKNLKFLSKNFFKILTDNKVTKKVEDFYTENPFPNYNDFESILNLLDKINENPFMYNLKNNVGFNKKFIEVGSGTSQLSLAMAHGTNNLVVALDPTEKSLKLGHEYAIKSNIENVLFLNADLFSDPIKKNSFDFVWCSGVLHHTDNPKKGFGVISNWLKSNGIIIIGLYNKYGRFWTVLRQYIYKILCKNNFAKKVVFKLDPYLKTNISIAKKEAWFQDQYQHPVESLHTIDEVIDWFEENDIEFLSSIPNCDMSNNNYKNIFQKKDNGTFFSRLISQLFMIFSAFGKEGGLFIVIGKKNKK